MLFQFCPYPPCDPLALDRGPCFSFLGAHLPSKARKGAGVHFSQFRWEPDPHVATLRHPYLGDRSWWGFPRPRLVYLLGAGKPCPSPCPLTPRTVTLSPAHCFLSGGISALEDSVFCVTPASAIPHIPVSSCPDRAGYQPGPRQLVERWAEGSKGWKEEVGSYCSSLVRVSGLFCGTCSVCSRAAYTQRASPG